MKYALLLCLSLFTLVAEAQKPKRGANKPKAPDFMVGFQHRLDSVNAVRDAQIKILDDKNGFRNFRFGDDISSYPSLTKKEEGDGNSFYVQSDENLNIGNATLKSIVYGFYKGKLFTVHLKTTGLIDSRKVFDALTAQYGPAFQQNKYIEKHYWLGKQVTLSYDENSLTKDSDIIFLSDPIMKQREEDAKAASKKAGSDL